MSKDPIELVLTSMLRPLNWAIKQLGNQLGERIRAIKQLGKLTGNDEFPARRQLTDRECVGTSSGTTNKFHEAARLPLAGWLRNRRRLYSSGTPDL